MNTMNRPSVSEGTLFRVVFRDRIGGAYCNYPTLLDARAAQLTSPLFRLRGTMDYSYIETAGSVVPGTNRLNFS